MTFGEQNTEKEAHEMLSYSFEQGINTIDTAEAVSLGLLLKSEDSHPLFAYSYFNMQASDRFNINSQLEHLQAKYVGTGHADMNRFEWAVNIQRDSYASYVGHHPHLIIFCHC